MVSAELLHCKVTFFLIINKNLERCTLKLCEYLVCLLSSFPFIYACMELWFLCESTDYSLIPFLTDFGAQIIPSLASWSPFQLAPVLSSLVSPRLLSTSKFFAQQDVPPHSPTLESAVSPKELLFLPGENVPQKPRSRC